MAPAGPLIVGKGQLDAFFDGLRQAEEDLDRAVNPGHRLVPIAHFERAIDFDKERDRERYRSDTAVQDEI